MAVYVDDINCTGNDNQLLKQEEDVFHSQFGTTGWTPTEFFQGIQVRQDDRGILLDQHHYTLRLLDHFSMSKATPVLTPLEPNAPLKARVDSADAPADLTEYMEAVGSLLYLSTCTRPDLTTAVSVLAQFYSNPSTKHHAAVKCVFCYLAGSSLLGILLPSTTINPSDSSPYSAHGFRAFSDSDWADCNTTTKAALATSSFMGTLQSSRNHQSKPVSP